ncbi:OmpA family protein [Humitalea sp. 24SJ18S-53]|uniref:OmpA family protein n=1 Tax=Humitalea sp. 24SJ18S-53 TaxID=3422307 RepID=UPI003D67D920
MSLKKALLAATMLSLPLAAQAQPITGVYIGGGAGVNFLDDMGIKPGSGTTAQLQAAGLGPSGNASFATGWVGVVSVGWGFGNGVRAEVEGNFRQNDVDSVTGFRTGVGATNSTGSVQQYGVMANALFDFDLGLPIVPYLGVGAGYVVQKWNSVTVRQGSSGGLNIDGDDGQFAYQGIVGAAFPIAAVPGLSITAEYRIMATLEGTIDATLRNQATGATTRTTIDTDGLNNSLLIGLRYAFGVEPPPAPVVAPAAAPAPARTYLVFFDWNRADLTDRARQIIAEAAQNSRRVQVTRIEVNGFTDTSGSAQYNQGLSVRRAEAVAAELARLGIARSSMTIQGFGQTRLLVPTADNVREPQNRRVEIILR